MGQKVYPTGFRLGITENWRSRWFAEKNYAETLGNDLEIRKFLSKRLSRAAVSRVEIERAGDKVKVIILTARPGIVIGKKGAEIDGLRTELEKVAGVEKGQLSVDVIEIKRPELDANLVAQSIAEQLEGRVAFRRAMRKAVLIFHSSMSKWMLRIRFLSGKPKADQRDDRRSALVEVLPIYIPGLFLTASRPACIWI